MAQYPSRVQRVEKCKFVPSHSTERWSAFKTRDNSNAQSNQSENASVHHLTITIFMVRSASISNCPCRPFSPKRHEAIEGEESTRHQFPVRAIGHLIAYPFGDGLKHTQNADSGECFWHWVYHVYHIMGF